MLGAQLQPHFLFNTLHAISALIWEDPARAERLLARLSEMLRLTLRSGTRVETTLAEEVALLRRYAEIQEARYGERLRVCIDMEPGVREAMVPRLILQPLVENAIRHGITRRITPGLVDVRAWAARGGCTSRCGTTGSGSGAPARSARAWGSHHPRPAQAALRRRAAGGAVAAPAGGAVCALAIPLRLADVARMTAPAIRALIVDDEPLGARPAPHPARPARRHAGGGRVRRRRGGGRRDRAGRGRRWCSSTSR